MSDPQILYEDNHLIIVNKRVGELVQGDKTGDEPLSKTVANFIAQRDSKPGDAFLGVAHRLDRPVSGVTLFAKTSKGLERMNEMFRTGTVKRVYWAIVAKMPPKEEDILVHYLTKNEKQNKSYARSKSTSGAKEAKLHYKLIKASDNYFLLEVELITGRHHQIRSQLAAIGSPVKGDLKYGAPRSNPDGGISLHAKSMNFMHPVKGEKFFVEAPAPNENLWNYFSGN
ncbi:MAG: RluA family pseudouridine synthase [Bacteroidales bacterium]